MLKLTRTQSGMTIITVKALGLYANVSCGKAAKAKRLTDSQIERLSTKEERNAASWAAGRASLKAGNGSLSIAVAEQTFPVYVAYRKAALRRMVETRLAPAPAKRSRLNFDAFGAAACVVLAFSAFLSF